jgi:dynein axonemal assembly factor 1
MSVDHKHQDTSSATGAEPGASWLLRSASLESSLSDASIAARGRKMDAKTLKQICKERDLFLTPELNDKLFLQCESFSKIENLESFTGVQALWLENNSISTIEGLSHMKELRCLYLHSNAIEHISGLDDAHQLATLNLARNSISRIENLSHLSQLSTLILAGNKISEYQELSSLQQLSTLDLSRNQIASDDIIQVLSTLPNLRCLYLKGNPFVRNTKNYRRMVISACKSLQFLDDRPVDGTERACAVAWQTGGKAAASAEKERLLRERHERDEKNMSAWKQMIEDAKQRHAADKKLREATQQQIKHAEKETDAAAEQHGDRAKVNVASPLDITPDAMSELCMEHMFDFEQVAQIISNNGKGIACTADQVRLAYAAAESTESIE